MSIWKRLLVTIAVIAIRKDPSQVHYLPEAPFSHVSHEGGRRCWEDPVDPLGWVWPFPALSFLENQLPQGGIPEVRGSLMC